MVRNRSWRIVAVAALVFALTVPAGVAQAATLGRIVVNVGVKTARLGMGDTAAARRIGLRYRRLKDTNYASTVYVYYFGKKSGGKYPIVMYSNKYRKVFIFQVNSSSYVTAKKVRVGTAASVLRRVYGSALKRGGSTNYYLKSGSNRTDFYLRSGRVSQIMISRY
ncbi:MAG: hypothetical protein Q7W30_02630 [Coriobacteriia bacterium]|nr:hypothetical protein [Coriobacteriia bacterium]